MSYGLLSPKVDFVFKRIFGNEKHPEILISFLNAVMKPINPIKKVKIRNSDIEKEHIEDKYSRLDGWVKFINNPSSDVVKRLEMNVCEIKQAKDELIRLSGDKKEVEFYEQRKFAILDRVSDLENAEEKGKKIGKIEVAKNLLDVLDVETIAAKTGLSVDDIEKLKKEL